MNTGRVHGKYSKCEGAGLMGGPEGPNLLILSPQPVEYGSQGEESQGNFLLK